MQVIFILLSVVLILSCNGQNSIVQRTDPGLKFSSLVRSVFEDSEGNFWFGSHSEGVCRYDGKQFTCFTEEQGLADNQVRTIEEDRAGNLWFGTGNGVSRFNGQSFTTIHPEKESQVIASGLEPPENEPDHLWFDAGNRNGVHRYDGSKLIHLTFPVPEGSPEFDEDGYNPAFGYDTYAVYGIYKDKEGNLWFGTMGAGLYRYDGKSLTCINENDTIGVVRAIHQDRAGKIWFGNNPKGVYYYDGRSLVNFSEEKGQNKSGLNGALAIEEDQDGNLWFGTYRSGLWRYNPSAEIPMGMELIQYTAESGLNSNCISAIYKDKKGNLWFGTGEGEVFRFNGENFDKFIGKQTTK